MAAAELWALGWALFASAGIGLHAVLLLIARNDWHLFARTLAEGDVRRAYVVSMLRGAVLGGLAKGCFLAAAIAALGGRADWWETDPALIPALLIVGLALLDTHTAFVVRSRWRLRYGARERRAAVP